MIVKKEGVNMENIKVEWCKNSIKSVFEKIPFENGEEA